MTSADLDPALALAYLRLLSTDIRDAAIATADGEPLAGNPALLSDGADELRRDADDHHQIVVRVGPHALDGVLDFDLRSVLGDLRTR